MFLESMGHYPSKAVSLLQECHCLHVESSLMPIDISLFNCNLNHGVFH